MIRERLKKLRKEKKITQKELSSILNINYANYNKYETTNTTPDIETLIKLANYHNVSIDYLVGNNEQDELGYLNKNEKELILMFRQMNQDNQLMFFAEAKGILLAQN